MSSAIETHPAIPILAPTHRVGERAGRSQIPDGWYRRRGRRGGRLWRVVTVTDMNRAGLRNGPAANLSSRALASGNLVFIPQVAEGARYGNATYLDQSRIATYFDAAHEWVAPLWEPHPYDGHYRRGSGPGGNASSYDAMTAICVKAENIEELRSVLRSDENAQLPLLTGDSHYKSANLAPGWMLYFPDGGGRIGYDSQPLNPTRKGYYERDDGVGTWHPAVTVVEAASPLPEGSLNELQLKVYDYLVDARASRDWCDSGLNEFLSAAGLPQVGERSDLNEDEVKRQWIAQLHNAWWAHKRNGDTGAWLTELGVGLPAPPKRKHRVTIEVDAVDVADATTQVHHRLGDLPYAIEEVPF